MAQIVLVVVQRVAGLGRSDAPWPRPISRLHRSAGGVSLLSFRIWSIHLQRGRPGRRFHLGSGFQPSDNLTWARRAWCAGTVVSNLAMWPKTALRRREIMSDMDGSPVGSLQWSPRCECWCCSPKRSHIHVYLCSPDTLYNCNTSQPCKQNCGCGVFCQVINSYFYRKVVLRQLRLLPAAAQLMAGRQQTLKMTVRCQQHAPGH